jgi:AcrR family transcriptional regulator
MRNEPASNRSLRKMETRQKLIDAAKKLFSCTSFEVVKVEDITREAGTAKGTFFNYFTTKEEIVGEMQLMQIYEGVMPLLHESGPIVPKIKEVLLQQIISDSQSKSLMRACLATKFKEVHSNEIELEQKHVIYEDVIQIVDRAKANGEIRADLPSIDVIMMVEQVQMGILMQWCTSPDGFEISQIASNSLDILFDGLKPNES